MKNVLNTSLFVAAACMSMVHCGKNQNAASTAGSDGGASGGVSASGSAGSSAGSSSAGTSSGGGSSAGASTGTTGTDGGAAPVYTRVDVAGVVVGQSYGIPLPNQPVIIIGADGVDTRLASDATGHFALAAVAVPYDVSLPKDAVAQSTAGAYYVGLTRADPTVVTAAAIDVEPPAQSVTITMTTTATYPGAIFLESALGESGVSVKNAGANDYSLTFTWKGASPQTVPVHGIVVNQTGTAVTGYFDIAAKKFKNGGTVALGTVAPTPLSAPPLIHVTYNVAPGDTFLNQAGLYTYPDGSVLSLPAPTTAMGSYLALQIPGVTLTLLGNSTGPTTALSRSFTRGVPMTAATFSFDLASAPSQLTPNNNATNVGTDRDLSWQIWAATKAMYTVEVDDAAGGFVTIYTPFTSINLNTLVQGRVGVQRPGNTWAVIAFGGMTVDDFVAPGGASFAAATTSCTTTSIAFDGN